MNKACWTSWVRRWGLALLLATLLGIGMHPKALRSQSYIAPTTVRVTMYVLDPTTGAKSPGPILCTAGDTRYGCTQSATLGAYPFGSVNPVTVSIEGTATANRYLRDVVTKEMSVSAFHATALRAQAIAARTYLYSQVLLNNQIDNSTQYQVFVPRAYDALSPTDRGKVDAAVAQRLYMSYGNDLFPIVSMFFADVPLRTRSGTAPYLVSVEDPISSHPEITPDGHEYGMSQKGAGRWARGNRSFNLTQDLGAWPVVWTDTQQILTHYYSGIHVRNADNSNAILTPVKRSVELNVSWFPSSGVTILPVCPNASLRLTARVQNTGITTWPTDGSVYYSYVVPQGAVIQQANSTLSKAIPPQPIAPGAAFTATLTVVLPSHATPGWTIGVYPSMFQQMPDGTGISFGNLESGRPWPLQPHPVPIVACPKQSFLPLLQWPPNTPASSNPIQNPR